MRALHVSLVDEVGHRSVQARMVARFGVVLERSQDCVSSRKNAFLARGSVGAFIAIVSREVGCRCGSEASLYPNAKGGGYHSHGCDDVRLDRDTRAALVDCEQGLGVVDSHVN